MLSLVTMFPLPGELENLKLLQQHLGNYDAATVSRASCILDEARQINIT